MYQVARCTSATSGSNRHEDHDDEDDDGDRQVAPRMSISSMSKFLLFGICSFSILNAFLWYLTSRGTTRSSGALDEHLLGFRRPGNGRGGAPSTSSSQLPSAASNTTASTIPQPGTFSACLLMKDDNDILNEWLAYHYYALDLRYVVVALDPSSQTSPETILDKWMRHTDLKVAVWNDRDYMPERFFRQELQVRPRFVKNDKWHEGHEDPAIVRANYARISNHRFRQLTFLSACLNHMRRRGRTLVVHIDTDEYVALNPKLRRVTVYRNRTVPSLDATSGAIAAFVQSVLYQDEYLFDKANLPCLSMPRLLFGSVEDPRDSSGIGGLRTADANDPVLWDTFNRTTFETQRWKYHAAYNDSERNAQPKVIVDVSLIPRDDQMLKGRPFSIHRPSRRLCRWMDQMVLTGFQRYPLIVHHYLGTWERYVARNDSRRSARLYHRKAHVMAGRDEWIAGWLAGFVRVVGIGTARILLDRHLLV